MAKKPTNHDKAMAGYHQEIDALVASNETLRKANSALAKRLGALQDANAVLAQRARPGSDGDLSEKLADAEHRIEELEGELAQYQDGGP